MEQLIATRVKTPELILGKMIPYYVIGIVDMALSITLATLLFEVPFRGSLFLLTVISTVFLFGGLSFGLIISIITKSQIVSSQMEFERPGWLRKQPPWSAAQAVDLRPLR